MHDIGIGDSKALEKFYKIYGRLIYVSAFSITKSEFLANEVVDDVLWKIWTNAKSIKKVKNDKGFVYTITVNCAKDKLRSEAGTAVAQQETGDPFNEFLDRDEFLYDISCLNEKEQEIVILRIIIFFFPFFVLAKVYEVGDCQSAAGEHVRDELALSHGVRGTVYELYDFVHGGNFIGAAVVV